MGAATVLGSILFAIILIICFGSVFVILHLDGNRIAELENKMKAIVSVASGVVDESSAAAMNATNKLNDVLIPQAITGVTGQWTDAALCVLKNGSSCPTGFQEIYVFQKGIQAYSTKSEGDGASYSKHGNFGASYMEPHAASANWYFDMHLMVCCK